MHQNTVTVTEPSKSKVCMYAMNSRPKPKRMGGGLLTVNLYQLLSLNYRYLRRNGSKYMLCVKSGRFISPYYLYSARSRCSRTSNAVTKATVEHAKPKSSLNLSVSTWQSKCLVMPTEDPMEACDVRRE